jgi:hypothetical protein
MQRANAIYPVLCIMTQLPSSLVRPIVRRPRLLVKISKFSKWALSQPGGACRRWPGQPWLPAFLTFINDMTFQNMMFISAAARVL